MIPHGSPVEGRAIDGRLYTYISMYIYTQKLF